MSPYDVTLVNAGPNAPRLTDGRLLKPPPQGILSLGGWLELEGLHAQLLDYQLNDWPVVEQFSPTRFAEYLETKAASEVIGISTMGGMLPIVLLAVEQFKTRYPGTTVILGGAGPSNVADEILRKFPGVDVVVDGEGEIALTELLRRPHDRGSITGIAYRDGGEVRRTPGRPWMRDIDQLPIPAYGALPMERYVVASICTSRGCPFKCTFCEVPAYWGRRAGYRSLDRVIEEISLLHNTFGKQQINLSDDTFVSSRKRVQEFCRRLDKEGLDIRWECFGRVDLLDDDLMRLMADHNCTGVFFGIESGNDRMLEAIQKNFTARVARNVVERALRHFKTVYTSFVWGFPEETMEEFFDSVMLMSDFARMGARVQRPYLSLRHYSPLYHKLKHLMAFSEDLPIYFLELPRHLLPPEVVDLVRSDPVLFPGYYYVKSDTFEAKRRFMSHLEGLGEQRWEILADYLSGALDRLPEIDSAEAVALGPLEPAELPANGGGMELFHP